MLINEKIAKTLCQCPICKKDYVCTLHSNEPYWEKFVEGIMCLGCKTRFKKIVLDDSKTKCIAYGTEE